MQLSELIDSVQEVIQDNAWTDAKVTELINSGLRRVANGVMVQGKYQLTPPLPYLYTVGTVTTTLNSGLCALPDDFNRDIVKVINSSGDNVAVYDSFLKFVQKFGNVNDNGDVYVCSRHGLNLIYRDIPATADALTLHYYCKPDLLTFSTDEPVCIPEELHQSLLVSYACSKIFEQIEDGIEGQKVNTGYWLNRWYEGLLELEIIVGFDGKADYYEDYNVRCD